MHGNLRTDRSNSLADLAARIVAEHGAAGSATQESLQHAIVAGALLIEAKPHIGRGQWLDWLEKYEIPQTTASLYMRLAKSRKKIESLNSNTVASLTIRGALRLLKPPRLKTTNTEPKPVKSKPAVDLSSLSWSDAPEHKRKTFVDAIGLKALYEAAPADHQEKFRAWLLRQEAPAIEQPQPDTLLPADGSIPEFLRRRLPTTETVSGSVSAI
jgi:hypothetical protein